MGPGPAGDDADESEWMKVLPNETWSFWNWMMILNAVFNSWSCWFHPHT